MMPLRTFISFTVGCTIDCSIITIRMDEHNIQNNKFTLLKHKFHYSIYNLIITGYALYRMCLF